MKMCPRTRNHIHRPFSNVATLHHNGSGAIYLPHRVLLPAMRRVIVMTKVGPAVRRTRRMHPNHAPGAGSRKEEGDSTDPDTKDHGETGNGWGSNGRDPDEYIQKTPATPSTTPRNTFVGQLNIKTREGYQQLLEVEFRPVISIPRDWACGRGQVNYVHG